MLVAGAYSTFALVFIRPPLISVFFITSLPHNKHVIHTSYINVYNKVFIHIYRASNKAVLIILMLIFINVGCPKKCFFIAKLQLKPQLKLKLELLPSSAKQPEAPAEAEL